MRKTPDEVLTDLMFPTPTRALTDRMFRGDNWPEVFRNLADYLEADEVNWVDGWDNEVVALQPRGDEGPTWPPRYAVNLMVVMEEWTREPAQRGQDAPVEQGPTSVTEADLLERARARRDLPAPQRAREIRELAGFTQAEVARVVGVIPMTVWRWEKGTSTPRGEHLVAYVEVLKALVPDYFPANEELGA